MYLNYTAFLLLRSSTVLETIHYFLTNFPYNLRSLSNMASPLPPPNRVTVAHSTIEITEHKEPGVDVLVDTLEVVPIMEGLKRARVASHASVPASNNEP